MPVKDWWPEATLCRSWHSYPIAHLAYSQALCTNRKERIGVDVSIPTSSRPPPTGKIYASAVVVVVLISAGSFWPRTRSTQRIYFLLNAMEANAMIVTLDEVASRVWLNFTDGHGCGAHDIGAFCETDWVGGILKASMLHRQWPVEYMRTTCLQRGQWVSFARVLRYKYWWYQNTNIQYFCTVLNVIYTV